MNIGPSKGKDFCTVMGPCITTMDELDEWNIELSALVNGELWSKGTTASRKYSFAEVPSVGVVLRGHPARRVPGDRHRRRRLRARLDRWIQPGDVVELSSPQLGTLRNPVGSPEQVPADAGIPSYHGAPRFSARKH